MDAATVATAPSRFTMFLIMLAALLIFVFLLWIINTWQLQLQRLGRLLLGTVDVVQRSATRSHAANTVQQRSARPNAENDDVQGVQAFSERSDLNAPPSADDLQKLTRAILLYTQRPNKQIAIESSWGCTKGEGEDWQRASWLFDQAMSLDNKEAAKQVRKGEPVVRDDLQMEPLP